MVYQNAFPGKLLLRNRLHQNHQHHQYHHLGTCWKDKIWGPTPDRFSKSEHGKSQRVIPLVWRLYFENHSCKELLLYSVLCQEVHYLFNFILLLGVHNVHWHFKGLKRSWVKEALFSPPFFLASNLTTEPFSFCGIALNVPWSSNPLKPSWLTGFVALPSHLSFLSLYLYLPHKVMVRFRYNYM